MCGVCMAENRWAPIEFWINEYNSSSMEIGDNIRMMYTPFDIVRETIAPDDGKSNSTNTISELLNVSQRNWKIKKREKIDRGCSRAADHFKLFGYTHNQEMWMTMITAHPHNTQKAHKMKNTWKCMIWYNKKKWILR